MINTIISMTPAALLEGRSSKLEQFLRITEQLKLTENGPYWIAGGLIRRTLTNMPLEDGDIDVFFRSEDAVKPFLDEMKLSGWTEDETEFPLPHVHNLKKKIGKHTFKMQAIILQYFTGFSFCLDSFDYTICQLAYDGKTIHTTPHCLMDNGNRRLVVHNITYPIASLRRLVKYTGQGYYPCNGCLQQIAEQIRGIPADKYFTTLNTTYID